MTPAECGVSPRLAAAYYRTVYKAAGIAMRNHLEHVSRLMLAQRLAQNASDGSGHVSSITLNGGPPSASPRSEESDVQ